MTVSTAPYRRIGAIRSVEDFRGYLKDLKLDVPVDDRPLSAAEGSPLAGAGKVGGFRVGNRWAIQPMEGWDGTADGRPTDATFRRWRHFGESGAKLIWGGEAFAVTRDGRANPNQLYYEPAHAEPMQQLHRALLDAHRNRFGARSLDDLLVGLQLTHSGRFARPNEGGRPEPRIAYHHPLLDGRVGIAPGDGSVLLDDRDVPRLIDAYVRAAEMAADIGFQFVDIKACHGYLGHEFLSAHSRPGRYGGDFEGRTRFLRQVIEAVRGSCPGLMIGVRLSVFDFPPFRPDVSRATRGRAGPGVAEGPGGSPAFGCRVDDPFEIDLTEPIRLLRVLRDELGVEMVNLTAGSPYYNPHIQRPAYFPPSDGYDPPEDPLVGCARQMDAARRIRQAVPGLPIVGSAYSYFQEYLPHVAQGAVGHGWTDFVGLGRNVLSYWDMPADVLEGRPLQAKRFCRTFSECTTAPRNGLPSGCYPLDGYYKKSPEAVRLRVVKTARQTPAREGEGGP